jgi:nicotinamide-nucleotide amidase
MKIGEILKERSLNISVAESCTGGYIAHKITSVPGSSDYFPGGIIAYNNSIKQQHLGVQQQTLDRLGAVSEETVIEMASGVRQRFNSDIGLATSGIAGPGGGTPNKPVGLVWIAICDINGTVAKKFNFTKNRVTNIKYFTVSALTFLWQRLNQNTGIDA